jgi:hypothetical protein
MSEYNSNLVEQISDKLDDPKTRAVVESALGRETVDAIHVGAKQAANARDDTMPRDEFDALPPRQRNEFMSRGGRVTPVDEPT